MCCGIARMIQVFQNQRVLCVGGRASGADLAREIVPYAKRVVLSDTTCTETANDLESNVLWVPATTAVLPNGDVQYADGTTVTVDVIIFCTGYDYHFPFLASSIVATSPRSVSPLGTRKFSTSKSFPNSDI